MTKDHVDTTSITHLSLCTGYGGIDLGLARVVSNLCTIAYCEREAAAVELLLSRMEGGQLDAAPIWTDLRTFPWAAFSDRVDILSGGYPCQPFSTAGKRLGAEDERHLWPAIADGIRILRPRICFFENVEGHISLGLREVIEELEGLGYRTTWGIFSAAEVGAPHQRKRVFIMAYRNGERLEGGFSELTHAKGWQESVRSVAGSGEDWKSSQSRATGTEQPSSIEGRVCAGEVAEEQVWPSRPGDVGDTEDGDGTKSCVPLRPGQGLPLRGGDAECGELADSTIGRCNRKHAGGRSDVGQWSTPQDIRPEATHTGGCGGTQAWPSRPGEPQHGWEPPRVVANTGRDGSQRRSAMGEVRERDAGEESQGKSSSCSGTDEAGEWQESQPLCSGPEPAVGNAKSGDGQWGASRSSGHAALADENSVHGQAEPEVGGGADGVAGWMGYAELCISSDNRTDELRMLGNGVVPATAARAFLTLMEELNNHHEQNRATIR